MTTATANPEPNESTTANSFLAIPINRPMATLMFYLALVVLGAIAVSRMPVSLFPVLEGEIIRVNFNRSGADPELVERDILVPLMNRVSGIADISETRGMIQGSGGQLTIQFEPGTDIKVREFEVTRITEQLRREQPANTSWIGVGVQSTDAFDTFVMNVAVAADHIHTDTLFDLASSFIAPKFASVSGVSYAQTRGGGRKQVTIVVDPDKVSAAGITTSDVSDSVNARLGRIQYVGNIEDETGMTNVLLDGRPEGLQTLGATPMNTNPNVHLQHVAEISEGYGREQELFRVNGEPAVGIAVYQEENANLIEVGNALLTRVAEVQEEMATRNISLTILDDASEMVDDQITDLWRLAGMGFCLALVVLFLLLRQWRAVFVVGIAVPVSILLALALLYLLGYHINLLTLAGLSISVGLLVDNSIVVYEAILRGVEQKLSPTAATQRGLKRTLRAIVAASITTAIVFLPVLLIDIGTTQTEEMMKTIAASFLLPVMTSLLVAVGLVPLLAYKIASRAAIKAVDRSREQRQMRGGVLEPKQIRMLLGGLSKSALRYPSAWLATLGFAIIVTLLFVLPGVFNMSSNTGEKADSVQLNVRFSDRRGAPSRSLEQASVAIARVEDGLLEIPGVETVIAQVNQRGGQLLVKFVDIEDRPVDLTVSKVRSRASEISERYRELSVNQPGERDYYDRRRRESNWNQSAREIIVSGPSAGKLHDLAENIEDQLEEVNYVAWAWVSNWRGMDEIHVEPRRDVFRALGLSLSQILPVLNFAGDEGVTAANPYFNAEGRELPVVMEREGIQEENANLNDLRNINVRTPVGVIPLGTLAETDFQRAAPVITYQDGRREMRVGYRFENEVPRQGARRDAIIEEVEGFIRALPRPAGYSIELEQEEEQNNLMAAFAGAIVVFLFLVLATTFESWSLPFVVIAALPLTLLGASWVLALSGGFPPQSVIIGAVALFGISINPAILLVDRMQRKTLDFGWSPGAAALSTVYERTRPVLLTTATTITALLPLTISTGQPNEIWPGFATTMIGGLISSALLTLLIIPIGYILLQRLDQIFGRVGPWLMVAWLVVSLSIWGALVYFELIEALLWKIIVGLLIMASVLGGLVLLFRRQEIPEPDCSNGPPELEVTFLSKIYAVPGIFQKPILARKEFVERVLAIGGTLYSRSQALERVVLAVVATATTLAWGYYLDGGFWSLASWLVATAAFAVFIDQMMVARNRLDDKGNVIVPVLLTMFKYLTPWLAMGAYFYFKEYMPYVKGITRQWDAGLLILIGIPVLLAQLLRFSAVRQSKRKKQQRSTGFLRYLIEFFKKWARRLGGLDIVADQINALTDFHVSAKKGMIGILGPNGAGKTTLLRQLAGILDPTIGQIKIGGVPLEKIRNHLARWIGYLPQDARLPGRQTPAEYLGYYAHLYELPIEVREERVQNLLDEVGLTEKAHDSIDSLSGGMKQRVSVARTLLRLPPIIIVDEPTVGLDPRERIRFRNLLSRLARDRIVLFSTHVVDDVAVACERVIVLSDSQLKFDGTPAELAELAKDKVWETIEDEEQISTLDEDSVLAAQTPADYGKVRRRIISMKQPDSTAHSAEANTEDGYLWLLGPKPAAT